MLYAIGDILEVKELEVDGDYSYEVNGDEYGLEVTPEMSEIKKIRVEDIDEGDQTYLSEKGWWYSENMIKGKI